TFGYSWLANFLASFTRQEIDRAPVTLNVLAHPLMGCILEEQAKTQELVRAPLSDQRLAGELRLSFAALASAVIQGICTFAVAVSAARLFLGVASVTTAGGSSLIHSDPVRFALRYVSAFLATATLWVIWNGWRLRNRGSARWRRVPLTSGEKWNIVIGLTSSILSWVLIVAEVFAHQKMHPR